MASERTKQRKLEKLATIRLYHCAACKRTGGTLQRGTDGFLYHPNHLPEQLRR